MLPGIGSMGAAVAINRTKILLVVGLIFVWSFASLIPKYKDTVKAHVSQQIDRLRENIPDIKVDFHPETDPRTAYNTTKLAMLIEGRPIPHLVPQILHMMQVVPPDWRFLFIGSNESVFAVGRSFAIKTYQASGKLDLMRAPEPWEINNKEDISRMMTDIRFYDEVIPNVQFLLKYESDSMMCSNSADSLNDWLHYDWAGAPRTETDHFAGNGGLTLRKISAIRSVLSFQVRGNNTQPEDEWFGKRVSIHPGLRIAKGEEAKHFAVEEVWHEKPMGYHIRNLGNGRLPEDVWKSKEHRKKIFDYCPELAIIMDMKLERERCDGDNGEGVIDKSAPLESRDHAERAYVPAFRNEIEYDYSI